MIAGLLSSPLLTVVQGNSDNNWSMIGLVFFASGFVFYGYVHLRYRNSDKRFHHESRTASVHANMRQRDERVRKLTGLPNKKMKGANNLSVRGAQNPMATLMGLADQSSAKVVLDQVMRFRPDK